jgi:hypothetical protein
MKKPPYLTATDIERMNKAYWAEKDKKINGIISQFANEMRARMLETFFTKELKMSAEETAPSLQDWNTEKAKGVNLGELDALVIEYKKRREAREAAEEESTRLYKLMEETKVSILRILMDAGKSKYPVDGVGTVSIVNKYVVRTPKEITALRALRGYIISKYGAETADQMFTVNHQTLNSFFNKEKEAVEDPSFVLPGCEAPTLEQQLRFTKKD